ncbi:tryptophan 7-halogenase [Asticcacaulis machinosus]|uniref:Tryptophan 7-halogenase n=1 Tax=Asticcacaulis machinosus TaxID=2984211 RepID=A0ABT5HGQ2_9CAUL|nr:tryptophan 7-halogenase [Asticcacaulis machinosus]MDC7675440.1 tryptophan 7-halogenase [Asticcacaulis machinosus]
MARLKSILICGSGVAAWFMAAGLSKALEGQNCRITVLDDGAEGDSACLGRAVLTLPSLRAFHSVLGIPEDQVIRATRAWPYTALNMGSYHIGIGDHGARLNAVAFHHFMTWRRQHGQIDNIDAFSIPALMSAQGKFTRPVNDPNSVLSGFSYGLVLDVGRYSDLLRHYALSRGVDVAEGCLTKVDGGAQIASVHRDQGVPLTADLYIDATGAAARLMSTMDVPFEADPYLKANRIRPALPHDTVVPVMTAAGQMLPVMGGTITDDVATDGEGRAFVQGRRAQFWAGNVLAVGHAGGVLQPFMGHELQLLHTSLIRLIGLFPDDGMSAVLAGEYNRLMIQTFDRVRDFVLLPQVLRGQTEGSPELIRKITQFKSRGRVVMYDEETYSEAFWVSVFLGEGVWPERYDRIIDSMDFERLNQQLIRMRDIMARAVSNMPPLQSVAGVPGVPA